MGFFKDTAAIIMGTGKGATLVAEQLGIGEIATVGSNIGFFSGRPLRPGSNWRKIRLSSV